MPFADTTYPSLGLSLLKALLAADAIAAETHYLNLRFADRLANPLHDEIVRGAPRTYDLAGEWIFAEALWGRNESSDRHYIAEVLKGGAAAHAYHGEPDAALNQFIIDCRGVAEPFIDDCMKAVPWDRYRVVGFSTMFQQQVAALALARRVKQQYPSTLIVFGGANAEGDMGRTLLRHFPFVDAVCNGEADKSFPGLVRSVMAGDPIDEIAGVISRCNIGSPLSRPGRVDLNALPFVHFDDYFEQHDACSLSAPPHLVFETSRGCWWGEKSHCTFCGLNAESMAFRQKTPSRALAELEYLVDHHGSRTRSIITTDDIMPHEYFRTVLPELAHRSSGVQLFYETKANLQEREVAAFAAAGVDTIQPGIESLSTPVLKRMRKGTTRLQNLQLLRLCLEYGIYPIWNFLVGFPGESQHDYEDLDALIPWLCHLTPPSGVARIRFDRFSPYFSQAGLGVRNLVPYPSYALVYRELDKRSLSDLAYYFDGEFNGKEQIESYTSSLRHEVERWRSSHEQSKLLSMTVGEMVIVYDQRSVAAESSFTLKGTEAALLTACRTVSHAAPLLAMIGADRSDLPLMKGLMANLVARGLVVAENDWYLSIVPSLRHIPVTLSKVGVDDG